MHVLVTGGAGFIGSHIVERLLAQNHRVTVVDNLSTGRQANLPEGVTLHAWSILDPGLEDVCRGVDAVVHAAAQTSVAASVAAPLADAEANVMGTIRTVTAAARAGVRRLVYLSSAAVYGTPLTVPIPESHPVAPSSPYGLSKWAGEYYSRLLAEQAGMTWMALRLANVYGPRQAAHGEAGVIARWTTALLAGVPLQLHGDGTQTRDFIFVTDVAEAAAQAVMTPHGHNCAVNIGTGMEVALRDLMTMLQTATGCVPAVISTPARAGDIRRSVLDSTRARRLLGWRHRYSLRDGLAKTAGSVRVKPVR